MKRKVVKITEDFITLGQLLKHLSLIGSGGMAKWYLSEFDVYVDGELENRRGKKLYSNTVVRLSQEQIEVVIESDNHS